MVSRFPAGAPVQCNSDQDGSAVTLATFNRPFTREELLGKLELVVYIDNGENDFAGLMHTATEQPETPSAINVINTDGTEGRLYIDGTSLKVYNNNFAGSYDWIFDIDFDHQHRKNLELTEGFYYLEIPQLIEASPDSDLHAVVKMGSLLEDGITLIGHVEEDNTVDAIVYSTEDSMLDLGAWYNGSNNGVFFDVNMNKIFTFIIEMEYHTTPGLTIGVTRYTDISGITIDGSFNPFTDGSPYVPPVPLRVVQRFPNGCPVTKAQIEAAGETGVPLITFNRPIMPEEMSSLHALCATYDEISEAEGYNEAGEYVLTGNEGGIVLELRENTLYTTNRGDAWDVLDIDYDHQVQRILDLTNIPSNGVQKYVTLPSFGPYNQDMTICVLLRKSSQDESDQSGTCHVCGNSNGDVKWWDNINGHAVYEDSEGMSNITVVNAVRNIISMEFNNITPANTVINETENPTGPINLLTATAL